MSSVPISPGKKANIPARNAPFHAKSSSLL
jgi:hypothetical protein